MWKSRLLPVALGFVAISGGIVLSPASSQEPNARYIMQRKLDHAHSILEALIMEDFETLEDSAGALRALSEEAAWLVRETPEYTERSTSFRRAVSEIERSAKEKNLDRAALGYVDMTLQCVRCHEFLRGTARADLLRR
jgi:hypothetical protein